MRGMRGMRGIIDGQHDQIVAAIGLAKAAEYRHERRERARRVADEACKMLTLGIIPSEVLQWQAHELTRQDADLAKRYFG